MPESIKRLDHFVKSLIAGKIGWLFWGYFFAVIWPIAGVLIGVYFLLVKKQRGHGAAMIFLSLLVLTVELLATAIDQMGKTGHI